MSISDCKKFTYQENFLEDFTLHNELNLLSEKKFQNLKNKKNEIYIFLAKSKSASKRSKPSEE